MKKINNRILIRILLILIFPVLFLACSDPSIESSWLNNEIIVDGSNIDWKGSLKYFDDEKVAIGISNDNDNIYFCLTTSDKSKITKIMNTGFTVWLDPQSSDGKTMGIQYPIKTMRDRSGQKKQKGIKNGSPNVKNDDILRGMFERFKINQNEILVVNEDNFPLNAYPLINQAGLEVKIDYHMHQLIYELKVPLANSKSSNVYADVLPNEILKVGFQTGEIESPKERERSEMGSGRGSSGGRMPRGSTGNKGGGMRSGDRNKAGKIQAKMTPIEFWMEVKLASKK